MDRRRLRRNSTGPCYCTWCFKEWDNHDNGPFLRRAAARFSFLLSAPIIAGAGLYEGLKLWQDGFGTLGMDFLWGFIAAGISGYLVIAFLMRYLARHTFYPFVYYRLILALIVAVALKMGGL
jgi:undecaprenyl pyrophosphate phosphatase UppP